MTTCPPRITARVWVFTLGHQPWSCCSCVNNPLTISRHFSSGFDKYVTDEKKTPPDWGGGWWNGKWLSACDQTRGLIDWLHLRERFCNLLFSGSRVMTPLRHRDSYFWTPLTNYPVMFHTSPVMFHTSMEIQSVWTNEQLFPRGRGSASWRQVQRDRVPVFPNILVIIYLVMFILWLCCFRHKKKCFKRQDELRSRRSIGLGSYSVTV